MNTVAAYSTYGSIIQRTTLSNYKLGLFLAHTGAVKIIKLTSKRVVAKVTGGRKRTTVLETTDEGLAFKCTCLETPNMLCKHLVATAIVTEEKASK